MVATTANITVRARWEGKDVERGIKTVDGDMNRLKTTMQRMAPILRGIGALMGVAVGAQVLRQTVALADAWKGYENRIRLFTNSAQELQKTQLDLFKISQRTRVSMDSTVALFAKLSVANKSLGLETDELNGVLETISQSLIISGGSAESANAAVIQLGQGLASGVLRGEELNSVLEQAPRLAMALANGMGVGIGALRELGAQGKITATQVIESLQSQRGVVESEFGKIVPTVETSWGKLTDAVGLYISEFDKSVGLTERLAAAINSAADGIAEVATSEGPVTTGASAGVRGRRGGAFRRGPDEQVRTLRDVLGIEEGAGRGVGPGGRGRRQREAAAEAVTKATAEATSRAISEALTPGASISIGRSRGGRFGEIGGPGLSSLESGRRGGLTGGAARLGASVGIGGEGILDRTLGGGPQGTTEQLAIQQRQAEALATSELELLQVRQQFELANARLNNALPEVVSSLEEVQRAELGVFKSNEQKRLDADASRIQKQIDAETDRAIRRAAAEAQRDLNRQISGSVSILQRLAPEFSSFIGAVGSLAAGDTLGAAVQGMHGLLDVIGLGSDANDDYAKSIERTKRSLQLASAEAGAFARSMGDEFAVELLSFQNTALTPLQALFENIRGQAPDDTLVQETERFFQALEVGTEGRSNIFDPRFNVSNLSDELQNALATTGVSFNEFIGQVAAAFGQDDARNLQDVGRQIFTVRDALLDLGGAAKELASPLERATVATFDIREQALRRQAQGAFNEAGSDVFTQAQVVQLLQDQIQALASAESAALQSLGNTAGVGVTTGTGTGGTGDGLGVVLDAGAVVDAGAVIPVTLPWSSAVQMVVDPSQLHEPSAWWDLVNIPSDLRQYTRAWYQPVRMLPWRDFSERRQTPAAWWYLVNIPSDLAQYTRAWYQVLSMQGPEEYAERRAKPDHYGWMVDLKGDELKKYERNWYQVVDMKLGDLEDRHTPAHWAYMTKLPDPDNENKWEAFWRDTVAMKLGSLDDRHTPVHWAFMSTLPPSGDESKWLAHWSDTVALEVGPEENKHSPGHWGVMVNLSEVPQLSRPYSDTTRFTVFGAGGTDGRARPSHWSWFLNLSEVRPFQRTFAQTVSLSTLGPSGHVDKHILDSWSDVLDVSSAAPIEIAYKDVIRFTGSPEKLSITDVIDLSELEGIIVDTHSRTIRNRD